METSDHIWGDLIGGHGVSAPQRSIEHLEERLDRQAMVCRALWELLRKHSKLEERDLVAKVAEIDLRDGSLDHRLKSPLLDCPNCGRKVNARRRICAYCGFKDFPTDVFEV